MTGTEMNTPDTSGLQRPSDFDGWWQVPESWVETPNQRRNGWSGMIRLTIGGETYYVKKQCNHLYRSLRHPLGWPTALREYDNIVRLQALGIRVPEPVFHGGRRSARGFEALLVTRELTGFASLDIQNGLSTDARAALARETGRVLGLMHGANLQHSCLYDKHIMVRWQSGRPEVALIDLEKLRRAILPGHAARHDMEQLMRHQTVFSTADWAILMASHRQALSAAATRP